jgi:hypothetical protein
MPDDGTSVGVWITDDSLVEDFDAAANTGEGTYSRSEHLRRAMHAYIGVLEGLRTADRDADDLPDRELRDLVKWAIIDELRDG